MNYPRKSKRSSTTRSVAASKSSTVGLVTPHAHWGLVPPMRRHCRETTTSCPHRTPQHQLSCKPGALHERREIRRLAHGKLGRLVDGELQVNSIVPLLASASLLPSSELVALTRPYSALALSHRNLKTRLQLSISRLTRPKFLPSLVSVMLSVSAWPTIWHLCSPGAEISVDLYSSHYSKAWQGQH